MTPDELEAHIRDCGRLMQQAMDDYEASGCFSDRGEADYWRVRMEKAIASRSQDQIRSMEERVA